MINIQRFFENHLSNREISAEELRQFTEDHLGRLAALSGAPASIAALSAPTSAAYEDFDAKLSARTTLLANQTGGTITKDEALQLIRGTVRQREGRIRDKFSKTSAAYKEFFPLGLSEINKARTGQIIGILDRLINAATRHQGDIGGPELRAEFTNLKAIYTNARDGQVDAKGELAQARAELATARRTLELQLGRNILAIASQHLGDPLRAKDYFNQSLLEDPTRSQEEPPNTPPQA